jgi:DNA-binding IclR family transcriptional regulator
MDRTAIVIVAQVDSPLPIRYSVRLGAQFPIWETSSGFLIAAHLAPSARELLLAQLVHMVDQAEIDDFKAKIEEIGQAGHEVRSSLMIPGIVNLCRPVFGHNGQIVAALTIPFMGQRANPASVEQADTALAQKAEALSSALGHSPT